MQHQGWSAAPGLTCSTRADLQPESKPVPPTDSPAGCMAQLQGEDGEVAPALVPYACLINHSARPHIVRFSKVDPSSGLYRCAQLGPAMPAACSAAQATAVASGHMAL